jgi:phospho-N-acetylmuramoyl-pentapeptide-transferase
MILELLRLLEWSALENLVRYLTFRAAAAAVTGFLVAILLGPWVIEWLRGRKIAENTAKTDSLRLAEMHHGKRGTPTMGGVLVIGALLVSVGLFGNWRNPYVTMSMLGAIALCGVGFLDDWIKLNDVKRPGLKARHKALLQVVICASLAYSVTYIAEITGDPAPLQLRLPFLKDVYIDLSWWGGVPYVAFATLVMVGCSNAVNLTDGLDGLATGCSVMATLALTFIIYVVGRQDFTSYLLLPHVPGAAELTIVGAGLAGACLGFLWFNAYPAQVFMGDTGSLPIGGVLGFIAIVGKQELVLPIVGGLFVVEALSVILQVGSFKLRGKRIFKIAPLHHHFQFLGWHEVKIVTRFWIVGAICAIVGIATLKVR